MTGVYCWSFLPFPPHPDIPILSEIAHFQGQMCWIGNSPPFPQLWVELVGYRDVSRRDRVIQVLWQQPHCRPSSGTWEVRATWCSGVLWSTRIRNLSAACCNKGSVLVPSERSCTSLGFRKGREQPCFQEGGFRLCLSLLVVDFLPGLTFYIVIRCLLAVPGIYPCLSRNLGIL